MEKSLLITRLRSRPTDKKNSCRGVVDCKDFDKASIEETEEHLKSQGVTKVHRVRGRNEPKELTHTYFLTFGLPQPPEKIDIGRLRVKVTPFVQRPQQCFRCWKLGHPQSRCKGTEVCRQCGYEAHEGHAHIHLSAATLSSRVNSHCKHD